MVCGQRPRGGCRGEAQARAGLTHRLEPAVNRLKVLLLPDGLRPRRVFRCVLISGRRKARLRASGALRQQDADCSRVSARAEMKLVHLRELALPPSGFDFRGSFSVSAGQADLGASLSAGRCAREGVPAGLTGGCHVVWRPSSADRGLSKSPALPSRTSGMSGTFKVNAPLVGFRRGARRDRCATDEWPPFWHPASPAFSHPRFDVTRGNKPAGRQRRTSLVSRAHFEPGRRRANSAESSRCLDAPLARYLPRSAPSARDPGTSRRNREIYFLGGGVCAPLVGDVSALLNFLNITESAMLGHTCVRVLNFQPSFVFTYTSS
jgi:hypothetical protein